MLSYLISSKHYIFQLSLHLSLSPCDCDLANRMWVEVIEVTSHLAIIPLYNLRFQRFLFFWQFR